MEIAIARPSEADALTEIAFAAKRHWGYPAPWLAAWKSALTVTPAFIAAHETYAARDGECIIGFYSLCRAEDVLTLEHLWVLPDAMGSGVGRALFHHAQRRARELGFEFLAWVSDPHAAGFYEHMGAERIGTRVSWVEDQRRELPVFRCRTSLAA